MAQTTSTPYTLVGAQFHFTYNQDPRLPSFECVEKSSISLPVRLFHLLMNNLMPASSLGSDHVLYTSKVVDGLGISARLIGEIFKHRRCLKMVCHIANRLLLALDGPNLTCELSPKELFRKIVLIALPYLDQPRCSMGSYSFCDWSRRKIVIIQRDRLHFFSFENILTRRGPIECYALVDQFDKDRLSVYQLKLSEPKDNHLEKECKLLCQLNRQGPISGIPPLPLAQLAPPNPSDKTYYGYIITSAFPYNLHPKVERWSILQHRINQLIHGVLHLHSSQMVHRNIQPSTLLIDGAERCTLGEMHYVCSISFFEQTLRSAATYIQSHQDALKAIWGTFYAPYVHTYDKSFCSDIIARFLDNRITLESAVQQLFRLMQARDIYALSRTIYDMITQKIESPLISQCEHREELSHALLLLGAPRSHINPIIEALHQSIVNPANDNLRFIGFNMLQSILTPRPDAPRTPQRVSFQAIEYS